MHGLRREMLIKQAKLLNIPFDTVELPAEPSMDEYTAKMEKAVTQLKNQGFTHSAFGDIFLEDLRQYRENQLKSLGVKCVFPLWKRDTKQLINEFISLGFKAIVICINADLLDKTFVGRVIDSAFINDLPDGVDPCGENGEFHTFCFDGPIFSETVNFFVGEKTYREYQSSDGKNKNIGFWFCDLLP